MYRRFAIVLAIGTFVGTVSCGEGIDFEKQIKPVFVEHCGKCHGEKKGAKQLRLHTADAIQRRLEKDGNLIVTGKPDDSKLFQRLVLPANDKKLMPKGGEPLAADTIKLIRTWIEEGAVLAMVAPATAGDASEAPADPGTSGKREPAPLPEVEPADPAAIDAITQAGGQVLPLFSGSHLLQVSFAYADKPADDATVSLLRPIASQLVSVNLSKADVTSNGLQPLADCTNLRVIHLENSNVDDAGLSHLAGLQSLEYLNLYGTGISDAGLQHLRELPRLEKLYLWKTKATYDMAMALEDGTEGLTVNLGYNHPVVAKQRLTKEKEQLDKQLKEAKSEEEAAKQKLEAAQKYRESLDARAAEVDKALKELEPKPEGAGGEDANSEEAEKPAEAKE